MTDKDLERANEIKSELRQLQLKQNQIGRCNPWKNAIINLVLAPGPSVENEIKNIDGKIVRQFIVDYSNYLNVEAQKLISEFENL